MILFKNYTEIFKNEYHTLREYKIDNKYLPVIMSLETGGDINIPCDVYLNYILKNNKIGIIRGSRIDFYRSKCEQFKKEHSNFMMIETEHGIVVFTNLTPQLAVSIHTEIPQKRVKSERPTMLSVRATPTGTISLSHVRSELGFGGQVNMNDSRVRKLAGVPGGSIAMSQLRGKSNVLTYKLTVGSVAGDLSQDMNQVGFCRDDLFSCGNLVSQQVENTSLYITHLSYSVMKNSIAPFFINLYHSPLIPNGLVGNGSKHTNHVDVTISGRTFRFSWTSHDGQLGYMNTANLSELVNIMNSNLNRTLDVTFRWFN